MNNLCLTSAVALSALALSPQVARVSSTPIELVQSGQAVNIILHDGNLSYSIPDGKVLLLEHLFWALESDSTHQVVSIAAANEPPGVGDFQLKFSTTQPDSWSPGRPMRLVGGGGASISILKNAIVDWRDVMIIGVLQDV